MHILVRETHSLNEGDEAVDLGLTPAPIVLLSFSDSDLGAAAAAWDAAKGRGDALPAMRLANLQKLRHPMSVDLFVEQVIEHARCVVVRLLGGVDYWRYGIEECAAVCRTTGTALVIVPGDGRDDPRFADLSTVSDKDRSSLKALLDAGGPDNTASALRLAAHLAGLSDAPAAPVTDEPAAGEHRFDLPDDSGRPLAAIVFYRSYRLAADMEPLERLAEALDRAGLDVRSLYVTSLKEPVSADLTRNRLAAWRPAVVINATGFSARLDDSGGSPLDAAGAPVLQVALSGSSREAWQASARGLSQADLAMQVVLPELDGRLFADAISFKDMDRPVAALEFPRARHLADADGIAAAADRAAAWARLATTAPSDRRVGIVLSDYPGAAGQAAHAVGLDAPASLSAFLEDMGEAGYRLSGRIPSSGDLARDLCRSTPARIMELETYGRLFAALPAGLRRKVLEAWGPAADDPAVRDGAFGLNVVELGNVVAAIQPDRGNALDRKASYHDPDLPPRHGYVAFYLWLRYVRDVHAIVHFGTHGTLEWLPGKAVAQSGDCFPARLTGGLPVLYPFIVNNPGEAAAAKRRLGAVTIGHLTPPLKSAGSHGAAQELEKLIDEYAAADGLDARRMTLLRDEILERATDQGLLAESGATEEMDEDERLARLDAYLCDVKELQIRDGLHIFGRPPAGERMALLKEALVRACPSLDPADLTARLDACAAAEKNALLAGLDGRFVEPGAAGAPTRGRADVLPTGRNLYTIDPRAVPTRSALALAQKAADALIARHLQEHGDWPRTWLVDLWGSTTIRTGGEDLALALVLMGVAPVWDNGSNRVNGFEVLPLAVLDRPRADVTLRISGLFRDTFEPQIALFDAAVRAVAARDHEDDESNPLLAAARGLDGEALRSATARIYGAVPGDYGVGLNPILERGAWRAKNDLGEAYLAASAGSYGKGLEGRVDLDGFAARVKSAQAFVHHQDHREIDLLEDGEYANHEGGFAAAAESLGGSPTLYHADISDPDKPVDRTVQEEIARVVRGRVANPAWLDGMMRHGYRGGAEMARALDALFGFAATVPTRLDQQFDLVFDATLGDDGVDAFLRRENPEARDAMRARFDEAMRRDLWRPRRNSVVAELSGGRDA